ncbi:hypothetical protein GC194_00810 [bacterium]|nr:hypothetical protein [bacterium]
MSSIRRFWRRLKRSFSNPATHFSANVLLLGAAVLENMYVQVFCKPVVWAIVVLAVIFLPFLFYPLLRHKLRGIKPLLFFFHGMASVACVYCIIFLEELNLLGLPLLLVGVGFLVYVPHIFLWQMLHWTFMNRANRAMIKYFLAPFVLAFVVFVYCGLEYKKVATQLPEAITQNKLGSLAQSSFMTERILGMHFKYHTRFSEYDGWRPPMHDPLLVAGYWYNGFKDPLAVGLEERMRIYHKTFPDKPLQMNCSCADFYSEQYFKDPIFRKFK